MTVSSETSRISYSGNGSQTAFATNFYFLANSHLRVVVRAADGTETVQVLDTDYTVSGAEEPAGGTVTFGTAPANGTTVVIIRDPPVTQLTDYNDQDAFPADSHERALDKLTMLVQRADERFGRAILLKETTALADLHFPDPISNQLLGWNADADALENKTAAGITGEVLPAVADRYIRRNTTNDAYEPLTAQQSANLDELVDVDPGAMGKSLLATETVDDAAALIGYQRYVPVRAAATGNVAIATALEDGDTLDGVTLAEGDLVLLSAQTAPAENGIYVVPASGAASRATTFDAYDDYPGAAFFATEGTVNAGSLWFCTSVEGGTLGTTALTIEKRREQTKLIVNGKTFINYPTGFVSSSVFFGDGGTQLSHTTDLEGYYNVGVGLRCLTNITTGSYNTFGGFEAGEDITTGDYNTGWGEAAGIYLSTGLGNSFFGWKAGHGISGEGAQDYCTFFGYGAGINVESTADGNTAMGAFAMGAAGLAGTYGTAVGYLAGGSLTTGNHNVFVGMNSGNGVTTGGRNTLIGYRSVTVTAALADTLSLYAGDKPRITANDTTLTLLNSGTVVIDGGQLRPAADNTTHCGGGSFRWTTVYAVTGTINTSDAREKTGIEELDAALAMRLLDLIQPFQFRFLEGKVEMIEVEDGDETEERLATEEVEIEVEDIEVTGGKARKAKAKRKVLRQLFDEVPLLDANGATIGTHKVPRTEIVPKMRQERVVTAEGSRTHMGFVAQNVRDALIQVGIDPADAAVFILDDPKNPDSRMGLRESHLVAILWACTRAMRGRLDDLDRRVSALEAV